MKRHLDGIDLWVEEAGAGAPTLLLCHGMSCTGEVWNGLRDILRDRWPGRLIVPDMRGHGRSDHGWLYGAASHAADMAALLRDAGKVTVCGHSMGGLVGMTLATGWFGIEVTDVIAIGVKLGFTEQELEGAARFAASPTRWFETREEATDRFLKVSGLIGLVEPGSNAAASGVVEEDGRYRLAADNRTGLVARSARTPEVHRIARDHANIVMACGADDQMAPIAETRALDSGAIELAGLGHNAHVEDPEAVWRLIAGVAGV